MRQVPAVTPGGIPRLTICEVLVELEKYHQRAKLTIRILERTSCLVQEFVGPDEVLWPTSFGRINRHTYWKSLCSNL